MSDLFSKYAHQKMLDLYQHHEHEVGSELYKEDPQRYAGYQRTNCITYALNCISYGFTRAGDNRAAREVWKNIVSGVNVISYLATEHNWECIYINPDTRNPEDGDQEHPFSWYLVKKYHNYYKLPVSFVAVDYRPTQGEGVTSPTPLNAKDIALLNLIKFGFGISRGGVHTWVFSAGSVYEVHWYGIGDDLYEKSPLVDFAWLSGVIAVPPETAKQLRAAGLTRSFVPSSPV
ncbi:MAG: hypothetical protein PHE17_03250 [Thiothrix sp.]|uniref:hypothetical protein n=1 Tax=Thiothrix sp. TaxID=1032 RepID=UPI00260A7D5A|nr:hypothetical protein [Thiothrix sp.]MDD5392016.1 hypothetical protein [Thiothrix sp.]